MNIANGLVHDMMYFSPVGVPGWIVFGDSWSAARESDTGRDEGWTSLCGVSRLNNFARSGSTAREWADDKDGCLSNVLKRAAIIRGPIIFSLVGNDIRHAADDGKISPREVLDAFRAVKSVVSRFPKTRQLVMIMYRDPYFGHNKQAARGVALMNFICKLATMFNKNVQRIETANILSRIDFDGKDFHPTRAGWAHFAEVLPSLITRWAMSH